MLVYFEQFDAPRLAIQREKISNIGRAWKLELVEAANPKWRDLYKDITR
jgi:putative endonuclease